MHCHSDYPATHVHTDANLQIFYEPSNKGVPKHIIYDSLTHLILIILSGFCNFALYFLRSSVRRCSIPSCKTSLMSDIPIQRQDTPRAYPPLWASILPIIFLLVTLVILISCKGAEAINDWSPAVLLSAALLSLILALPRIDGGWRRVGAGLRESATQILPAVPILIFISILSTTWMLGGIVPTFIHYGLNVLNARMFLASVCAVSACISVMTGSSWTTIATIGVAFMGIGEVMGYSDPWIAGAVISGAYFGDKVSPLSDTTVVASSSCGVDLFTHIRFLMFTAIPSLTIALIVFTVRGLTLDTSAAMTADNGILHQLHETFFITPWVLVVPAITLTLIILKVKTFITLAISSALGVIAMIIFQPQLPFNLEFFKEVWSGAVFDTPDAGFNDLVSTGGVLGMLPTIALVLSAMTFGGVMIGTGMLTTLSEAITRRISHRNGLLGATIGSGLLLNGFTADQYLSIIIGANTYNTSYAKLGLQPKVLSRTLEDSISVTSVLIPWNSCGLTQSAVLGVPTLVYFPYCIFNWLSPLMSFVVTSGLLRIHSRVFSLFRKIA